MLLSVLAALYGFAAGSLLPRPAYRLAVEPGEVWRTACPRGHPLPGWLGPGRCAECVRLADDHVAKPYGPGSGPLALVMSLVCAALAGAVGPRPELAVWLLLAPVLVLLSVVDVRVHRLPDVLTLSTPVLAVALLGLASTLPGSAGSWVTAALSGLTLGGVYLVLHLINPEGMGRGDVKLALTLGVVLGWYGWEVLGLGTFAGFLTGALYGAALLVTGRAGRKTGMPFGPFMVLGAFAGVAAGGIAV